MMTRPTLTTKSSWKMTRPATAPMPSAPLRSSSPMQITVMTPRRVTLLVPSARRNTLLSVSPDVLSFATPASRKRRLSTAMVRPKARPSAAQGCESRRAIRTAPAPTMSEDTMVRRSTLASALPPSPESPSSMFMAAPLQVCADLLDDAECSHRQAERQAYQQEGRRGVQRAVHQNAETEPEAHTDRGREAHAQEGHGARERPGLLGGRRVVRSAHP